MKVGAFAGKEISEAVATTSVAANPAEDDPLMALFNVEPSPRLKEKVSKVNTKMSNLNLR
jgi:hypothetical protein